MDAEELADAEAGKALDPFQQLAADADDYWHTRVEGLHADVTDGPKSMLTLSGLYDVVYRVATPSSHPTLEGLDWWAEALPQDRTMIHPRSGPGDHTYAGLAVALFAITLTINHYRLGWPDAEQVRAINDAMTGQ